MSDNPTERPPARDTAPTGTDSHLELLEELVEETRGDTDNIERLENESAKCADHRPPIR